MRAFFIICLIFEQIQLLRLKCIIFNKTDLTQLIALKILKIYMQICTVNY